MYVWYKICLQDLEVDIVFIVKTNEEIGNYIEKLIAKKFPSKRKFCQAYLKLQGISTNDDETRKMANRISQITNRLINELNSLYDRIKNIKNEFIKES